MFEPKQSKKYPDKRPESPMSRTYSFVIAAAILASGCGSDTTTTGVVDGVVQDETELVDTASTPSGDESTFRVEVWADNWSAVFVDGELVGEDSVPITTERSFNAETFAFEATTPFVVAIEAKDYKETDSGIEYIGEQNQQMGDGGIIAQITEEATGEVVAVTDSGWSAFVVHQAPLNTECERSDDPDTACEFSILDTPTDWTTVDFDDSSWVDATVWSAADVDPKDGYDQISWDPSAQLVWGADLEIDNTVLFRTTVS